MWYVVINFFQEALDMALPASQLAGRIPDSYIHMWAASLLRGKLTARLMTKLYNLLSFQFKLLCGVTALCSSTFTLNDTYIKKL